MGGLKSKPRYRSTGTIVVALLCVLLAVCLGTIHAVHIHPDGDVSHADCALCATAHLSAQTVPLFVTTLVTLAAAQLEATEPIVRSTTFSTFALYTRPPPVDALFA